MLAGAPWLLFCLTYVWSSEGILYLVFFCFEGDGSAEQEPSSAEEAESRLWKNKAKEIIS